MNKIKTIMLSLFCALLLIGTAHAEENALKGVKLGFATDRGLGVVATIGKFNGFFGNDGMAVDYIFKKEKLSGNEALFWYIGGGAFLDWSTPNDTYKHGDLGVRLPVGGELYFAKQFDVYVQLIPVLIINNNQKFDLDIGAGVRYQF